jgi:predicted enzyme related to lactoylglutathione lyase
VKRRPPEPIAKIGWIQTDCHEPEGVVPEAKATKNRVHLDVAVQDVDAAASRIIELGGTKLPYDDHHEDGYSWRIMADAEGNEFCLIYGQYQPGPVW